MSGFKTKRGNFSALSSWNNTGWTGRLWLYQLLLIMSVLITKAFLYWDTLLHQTESTDFLHVFFLNFFLTLFSVLMPYSFHLIFLRTHKILKIIKEHSKHLVSPGGSWKTQYTYDTGQGEHTVNKIKIKHKNVL